MKKAEVNKWIKKIDACMVRVGAERDKIDEMLSDLEDLKEDCENAVSCLQDARDALSELV